MILSQCSIEVCVWDEWIWCFKMKLAVIRIRGSVNAPKNIRRMLGQLGLNRPNNVTIVDDDDTYRGVLASLRHMVTYGTPSKEVLVALLAKRGEVKGYGRLDDHYIAEHTEYSSIEEFADSLLKGEASLKDIHLLKRTFRCSPPSKGYEAIKRSYQSAGAYGNRGEEIDELLKRMI